MAFVVVPAGATDRIQIFDSANQGESCDVYLESSDGWSEDVQGVTYSTSSNVELVVDQLRISFGVPDRLTVGESFELKTALPGVPFPGFSFLPEIPQAVLDAVDAVMGVADGWPLQVIGKNKGRWIKNNLDPDAPLKNGRQYLFFNLTTQALAGVPDRVPTVGYLFVLDPCDPMFYFSGSKSIGKKRAIAELSGYFEIQELGLSEGGRLARSSTNRFWTGDAESAMAVDGHALLTGTYHVVKVPEQSTSLEYTGSMNLELGGGGEITDLFTTEGLETLADARLLGAGEVAIALNPAWKGGNPARVAPSLTLGDVELMGDFTGSGMTLSAYALTSTDGPMSDLGLDDIELLAEYLDASARVDVYFSDPSNLGTRFAIETAAGGVTASVRRIGGVETEVCLGRTDRPPLCGSLCASEDHCTDGRICYFNVCSEPRPIGAACGEDVDCASSACLIPAFVCVECENDDQCPGDDFCEFNTCKEACTGDGSCPNGQFCSDGNAGPRRCKDKRGYLETCDRNGKCESGRCSSTWDLCVDCYSDDHCSGYDFCNWAGECKQPCTHDTECDAGYFCSDSLIESVRRCKPKRGYLATCNRNGKCLSNGCSSIDTCTKKHCDRDSDCPPTGFCGDGGYCRQKRGAGETCDRNGKCLSNSCTNTTCQARSP